MRKIEHIIGCTRRGSSESSDARRLPVWSRVAALVVALAFGGNVAVGTPLHPSEQSCNRSVMDTNGCEQMEMNPSPLQVTSSALCCFLDCQEPGPTGTFSRRIPAFNVATSHPAELFSGMTLPKQLPTTTWFNSSSFTPQKTYLKNLALLI